MFFNNLKNNFFIVFTILFVIPLSGLSIDIYVPSLPQISHFFSVDKQLSQFSITTYMWGFGLIQLFIGNIVDAVGRKKILLFGLLLYMIATLSVTLMPNIYLLIFLRFIQGVTVGCSSVAARAVISDLYEGHEFNRMFNYITIAWSIGPIIAPAIGGHLQHYFNWKANFYFLDVYTLIAFIMTILFVRETIQHKHKLNLQHILTSYKDVLGSNVFCLGIFCLGVLYSFTILFATTGIFLFQKFVANTPSIIFGYTALLMGLLWFLGHITCRYLIHLDLFIKMPVILTAMIINIICMVIVTYFYKNIIIIIFFISILIYLGGVAFPNYYSINVALFPKYAATAGSLTSGILVIITSILGTGSSMFLIKHDTPISFGYLFLILLFTIGFFLHKKSSKTSLR